MYYNTYCITQTLYNITYTLYNTDIIAIINTIYIYIYKSYSILSFNVAWQSFAGEQYSLIKPTKDIRKIKPLEVGRHRSKGTNFPL